MFWVTAPPRTTKGTTMNDYDAPITPGTLALTLTSIAHQLAEVKLWQDLGSPSTATAELAHAMARLQAAAAIARTHRPDPRFTLTGQLPPMDTVIPVVPAAPRVTWWTRIRCSLTSLVTR
jgi:hypothetical protein